MIRALISRDDPRNDRMTDNRSEISVARLLKYGLNLPAAARFSFRSVLKVVRVVLLNSVKYNVTVSSRPYTILSGCVRGHPCIKRYLPDFGLDENKIHLCYLANEVRQLFGERSETIK